MKVSTGGVSGLLGFLDTLQQGKAQRQQQQQQFSQEKLQSEQRMAESRRADAVYERGKAAEDRQVEQYNRELGEWKLNAPVREGQRQTALLDIKAKLPKERTALKAQWLETYNKSRSKIQELLPKLTDRNLTSTQEALIRGAIEDERQMLDGVKKIYGEQATALGLGDIFDDTKTWSPPDLLNLQAPGVAPPNAPGAQGVVPPGDKRVLPSNVGFTTSAATPDLSGNTTQPAPVGMGAPASVGQTNASSSVTGAGMGASMGAPGEQKPPPPPPTPTPTPADKPVTPPVNKLSVADILAGKEYKIEKDTTLTAADKEAFRKGLKDRGINEYEAGAYDFKPGRYNATGGVYRTSEGKDFAVGAYIPAEVTFNPVKATQIALPKVVNYIREWASTNKMTPYQAQVALGLDQPEIQLFNEKNEPQLQSFLSDGPKAVAALTSIFNRSTDIFNPTEASRARADQRGKDSNEMAKSIMEGVRDDIKRRWEAEQKQLDRDARSVDIRGEADKEVLAVSVSGINLGRARAYSRSEQLDAAGRSLATAAPDAKAAILQQAGIISGTLPTGVKPDEVGTALGVISRATMKSLDEALKYKPTSSLKSIQKLEERVNGIPQNTAEKVRKSAYYKGATKELQDVIESLLGRE
jgi:hypothetical protein